jgi:hypothetical protein
MRLALWSHFVALFAHNPRARFVGRFRTLDSNGLGFLTRRLRLSSIDARAASYAGIRSMTVAAAHAAGYALPSYCSDGFVIPYYDVQGRLIKNRWRWRNDPDARKGFAKVTEFCKYAQPSGTGCYPYLPRVRGIDWQKTIDDPPTGVFIVEGEFKGLALCLAGVPAVAVGGVWNWANQQRLLPELGLLAAHGRELYILFDSDTRDKPQVAAARYALARALLNAGGKPVIIDLPHCEDPESPDKTGADDFVRLNPNLKGDDLHIALLGCTAHHAEVSELFRLNAQYVIDESAARIVRLYDAEGIPADRRNEKWTRSDFCGLIENQKVPTLSREGKPRSEAVGDLWIDWSARNRVVGRVYRPVAQHVADFVYVYEKGRRFLNDFYGWASSPRPKPAVVKEFWTALLDNLFRQQSAENREQTSLRLRARKWFEQWWAYPVQHPGARMMNAAVLSGQQGGGKDMVGRAVGRAVYGEHYRLISPGELNSNFNASYMEAVSLIHAQELTSKTNKKNFKELLKAWITSPRVNIEQKWEKSYYADATFNFYMTTNPEDSIHLDWDDRRYFVWRIADARIQELMSAQWVADFHRVLVDSAEGHAALHHHLLEEVDCSDFDPNAEPPITGAKQFAQLFSTNEAESWAGRFATEQREKNPEGVWLVERERIKTTFHEKEFLAAFKRYFQCVGRVTVADFDRELKPIKVKHGLWVLKPTPEDLKENRFVTVAEARRRYEAATKMPRV